MIVWQLCERLSEGMAANCQVINPYGICLLCVCLVLESKHSSHAVSDPSRIISTRERRGLARALMKMNPRFQYPLVVMVMVVYGGG